MYGGGCQDTELLVPAGIPYPLGRHGPSAGLHPAPARAEGAGEGWGGMGWEA